MIRKTVLGWVVIGWMVLGGVVSAAPAQESGPVRVVNHTNRIIRLTAQYWIDKSGNKVERRVLWIVGPGEQFVLMVNGAPLVVQEIHYHLRVGQQEQTGMSRRERGSEVRINLTAESLPAPTAKPDPKAEPDPAVAAAKPDPAAAVQPNPTAQSAPATQDPLLRQRQHLIRQMQLRLGGKADDFFVVGLATTKECSSNKANNIICILLAPLTLGLSLGGLDCGEKVHTSVTFKVVQGRDATADLVLHHLIQSQSKKATSCRWHIFGRYPNQADAEQARANLDRIYNLQRDPHR